MTRQVPKSVEEYDIPEHEKNDLCVEDQNPFQEDKKKSRETSRRACIYCHASIQ